MRRMIMENDVGSNTPGVFPPWIRPRVFGLLLKLHGGKVMTLHVYNSVSTEVNYH